MIQHRIQRGGLDEPRAIRSWVAQGLLPEPLSRGAGARDPAGTVERLLAIRTMRDLLGMSLADIRRELLVASLEQVTAYAERGAEPRANTAPRPEPSSALAYLGGLRAKSAASPASAAAKPAKPRRGASRRWSTTSRESVPSPPARPAQRTGSASRSRRTPNSTSAARSTPSRRPGWSAAPTSSATSFLGETHDRRPTQARPALMLAASLDRAFAWEEGGSIRHLVAEVSAAPKSGPDAQPPTMNFALAVDVSGSMAGDKIDAARRAASAVADALTGRDRLSLVAFDGEAELLLDARPMDEAGRAAAYAAIGRLQVRGNSNPYPRS